MNKNLPYNQKGAIAIVTLMAVSVFALIVMTTVSALAANNHTMTSAAEATEATFYAAEAGINEALYRLIAHPIPPPFTLDINGIDVEVNIQASGHQRTIISQATDFTGKVRTLQLSAQSSAFAGGFDYAVQAGQGGLEMMNKTKIYGDVYANGSIFGTNPSAPKAAIYGETTVAAGSPLINGPEQPIMDTSLSVANQADNVDVAQSFQISNDEPLKKISLNIRRINTLPGDPKLIIANDDGNGSPSDDILITKVIPKNSIPTDLNWFDVEFDIGPLLNSGNTYWIILDSVGFDIYNHIIWGFNSDNNGYANGQAKKSTYYITGSWQPINGDFQFKTQIGTGTTFAKNLYVSGDVYAESIQNCNIENGSGYISSPEKKPFPLTEQDINDWKAEAEAGGEIPGGQISTPVTLGPKKINGDLILTNGANVTLVGNLWVTGDIIFQDPGIPLQLNSSYGEGSGILIADGHIDMKNSANISGSGNPKSFTLVISTHNSLNKSNPAIYARNNLTAALFYASHGMVIQYNGTHLNATTGYYVLLEETSEVTYDQNLLGFFVPSGGSSEEIDPLPDTWQEL